MIMVTNNDAVQLLASSKCNNTRQEKLRHLKYLNEFRSQQCLLFLEQQCQLHRPYTCFHWHFPNQKRRRPFKRLDGTFNYNPDVYCDKYDETTGSCTDGDDCPYAHRNAGDTERRYHPRYFKTGNCIYETTDSGACVKNGLHCAFAHGPDDIRLPVYDIREIQDASSKFTVNLPASLEKERVLSEDPKWNEMFHVLACYKTESCKKPPRMCRQGYSCPFYHNGKDKRRAPDRWRYRSTPCPVVRPGDEWQDSGLCEAGDACVYCHTRTEQQFHPEIYKSTKCNDVINSGYCPRGPFCAFAHCDSELTTGRDFLTKLQHERLSSGSHGLLLPNTPEGGAISRSSLVPSTLTMLPPTHANLSAAFVQRTAGQMTSFLPADSKIVTLTDTSKRSSQLPAPLLQNLMSPIGTVGSPPGSNLSVVSRGRRVGRCASPHQNIGIWQSPPPQLPNDRSSNLAYMTNLPVPCTVPDTLSNTALPSNVPVSQHPLQMGLYQYRHQGSNNPRVTGRHRSGSSISSEGGLPSLTNRDLTPPNFLSGAPNTSTYPGRCGAYLAANNTETLRFASPFVQQTSKPQHPLLRSTPRKHSAPPQQSIAPLLNTHLGVPQQQVPQMSTYTHPSTDSDSISGTRSSAMPSNPAPLLRGDIWNPNHSTSICDSSVDPFFPASWAWRVHMDSGNHSETSATETEVPGSGGGGGLFEFITSTSITSTHPVAPSTSVLGSSNRDSGLVLDFSMPASANLSDRLETGSCSSHLSHSGGNLHESARAIVRSQAITEDYDTQVIGEDPRGKSASELNRVPSDLFEDMQSIYSRLISSHSGSDLQRVNSADAGFQSPLDDILLHTQPGFECMEPVSGSSMANLLPNACSSPVLPPVGSDPMTIPGCNYDLVDGERDQTSNSFTHFASTRPSQLPVGKLLQQHQQQHLPVHRPPGSQNTWPVSFIDIRGTIDAVPCPTDLSSVATSQISHSFSPIVGTPVLRTNHKPVFDIGSSVESASSKMSRGAQVSATSNLLSGCATQPDNSQRKSEEPINTSSSPPIPPDSTCAERTVQAKNIGAPRFAANVNFNDLPQSPILMSSPFSNPGSELERLSLQRELDEIRQRLDSKVDEVETLKKQRDFVTEHLRDSLGVIRQLFTSLHVSSKDLSKPLFVDTTACTSIGSGPSTGPALDEDIAMDDRHPAPEVPTTTATQNCAGLPPMSYTEASGLSHPQLLQQPSFATLSGSEKTSLQQQQEALAALFSNPLVVALLNPAIPVSSDSVSLQPPYWDSSPYLPPETAMPSRSVLHRLQHQSMTSDIGGSQATATDALSSSGFNTALVWDSETANDVTVNKGSME